jgi:hypothetical protein
MYVAALENEVLPIYQKMGEKGKELFETGKLQVKQLKEGINALLFMKTSKHNTTFN